MDNVTIIGNGKLGSHLYYALKKSGYNDIYRIDKKTDKDYFHKAVQKSNLIFICTRDSDIIKAVQQLKSLKPYSKVKFIFHTSGALSSAVLKPLDDKNTFVGSFHPVQSFNKAAKKDNGKFRCIYIAVEGSKKAVSRGISIAKKLGSTPFVIGEKAKVFHHINSVIASNYLVTLIHQITNISDKSSNQGKNNRIFINGFKKVNFFDIYEPLITATIGNIGSSGSVGALSGPIERNDYKTLELHLKNLKRLDRSLLEFYIYMGKETIKLALTKKSITKIDAKKLTDLFYKYSNK